MSMQEIRFTMHPHRKGSSKRARPPRIPMGGGGNILDPDVPDFPPQHQQEDTKHSREGPHTTARKWRILNYVIIVWLVFLTMYIFIVQRPSSSTPLLPPVLAQVKTPSKWHIPFNLVPDADSNGRVMTLTVPSCNFSKLLRYDVCCYTGPYYACRAVSKTVGIEGYFTQDGKAVMHISHPNMVGARCSLMWIETRE